VRRFAEREIEPKVAEWNERGMVDRAIWRRLGEEGLLGANQPVEYGGAGGDFLYDAIIIEEIARVRANGLAASLHSDICLPYIVSYGNEEQKRKHVQPAIRGELILGIAMTEPGTGSDLAAVQTTARRDGDHYVLNGSKMFISNGQIGDLFIVVAKTDPKAEPPHKGISLILVEADSPGFVRGRKLAELATEVEIGQSFVDKLLAVHVRGEDIVTEVSMAKWWTTELQKRLTGQCLQLHGGYGFMMEYPIAGDYADAAVQSIYAGSNEIMKVIIARRLGLGG